MPRPRVSSASADLRASGIPAAQPPAPPAPRPRPLFPPPRSSRVRALLHPYSAHHPRAPAPARPSLHDSAPAWAPAEFPGSRTTLLWALTHPQAPPRPRPHARFHCARGAAQDRPRALPRRGLRLPSSAPSLGPVRPKGPAPAPARTRSPHLSAIQALGPQVAGPGPGPAPRPGPAPPLMPGPRTRVSPAQPTPRPCQPRGPTALGRPQPLPSSHSFSVPPSGALCPGSRAASSLCRAAGGGSCHRRAAARCPGQGHR